MASFFSREKINQGETHRLQSIWKAQVRKERKKKKSPKIQIVLYILRAGPVPQYFRVHKTAHRN